MTAIPFQPGDKVRITIDATVAEHDRDNLTFQYEGDAGTYTGYIATDAKAVTVLPGPAEPMCFEDYATCFEQIGDRPERLGDAS